MDALYEVEKAVIVLFALIFSYAEFKVFLKLKGSWIKLAKVAVGLYWAGYYLYSLYRSLFDLRLPSHQIFVRSGILITLALCAVGAIKTAKMLGGKK